MKRIEFALQRDLITDTMAAMTLKAKRVKLLLSIFIMMAGFLMPSTAATANRVLSKDYRTLPNSPVGTISDSDTFEYDDASRTVKATSGRYSNVCEMTYDEAGRKASESLTVGGQTYTCSLEYDGASRQTELTYPDGSIVKRTFTDRNQLETVDWNNAIVDTRVYDAGARLATCTLGNGLVTTKTYRNDNLVSAINTTGAVDNYGYTYDENKNKTSESITGILANYGFGTGTGAATVYDDEDRLTSWNRTDGTLNRDWNLSLVGNWNSITENGNAETRTHTDAHEIASIGANAVTHDAKGNLATVTRVTAEGPITLDWDFDNRLKSITFPTGTTSGKEGTHTYTYDALGRRVTKTVADATTPTTTLFVCAGQQVVCEYDVPTTGLPSLTSPDQRYVYGSYVDEPILKEGKFTDGTTTGIVYFHRNQQYSVTTLTDTIGNVLERYAYTAYGKTTTHNAAGTIIPESVYANPYTYTARRYDTESNLQYFRARYYDAELGRFISRDPVGFVDGMSLYRAYFALHGMDPLGLEEVVDRLPPNSWAAVGLRRIERMHKLQAEPNRTQMDELGTILPSCYNCALVFFGSAEIIKATFAEARDELGNTAADKSRSVSDRCGAKFLELTLTSKVTETLVQGSNSVGQSGPLALSGTVRKVAANRIVGKIAQISASVAVTKDAVRGEYDAENGANALLAFSSVEHVFRESVTNKNGKILVTTWADPGTNVDVVKGRWVMIGPPTRTTYYLSGLRGPKVDPYRKGVPFHDNYATKYVSPESLSYPPNKFDRYLIRRFMDQRILNK